MWEDYNYCWVVLCKNYWFHLRQNFLYRHRIPLGEADVYAHSPDIKSSFKVRCDNCHKEYVYKPSDVMKFEQELPESFIPHPLFRVDATAQQEENSAPDKVQEPGAVERRRGERWTIKAVTLVCGESAEKEAFQEQALTISVSDSGVLLAMSTPVALGQKLLLKNLLNRDEVAGRVTRLGPSDGGTAQVGVEFVQPAPKFSRAKSSSAD